MMTHTELKIKGFNTLVDTLGVVEAERFISLILREPFEIQEIRCIRHQISAEHGHELRRLAEYYRRVEQELRKSGKYRFLDQKQVNPEREYTPKTVERTGGGEEVPHRQNDRMNI